MSRVTSLDFRAYGGQGLAPSRYCTDLAISSTGSRGSSLSSKTLRKSSAGEIPQIFICPFGHVWGVSMRRSAALVLAMALTFATLLGVQEVPSLAAPSAAEPSSTETTDDATVSSSAAPTPFRGIFTVVHADEPHHGESLYFLRTSQRTYRLRLAGAPTLRPNTPVAVVGRAIGATLEVDSITPTGSAPAMEAAIGAHDLLVIQVAWPGASLVATREGATNFVFGSDRRTVSSFYSETSYGQMTWTGTVTPTLTISDPGTCNLYELASRADAAAAAAGYAVQNYDGRMINAPQLYCGAAGYGQVGGRIPGSRTVSRISMTATPA
jgi:hypothetical protein